jgi:hypothetical protein
VHSILTGTLDALGQVRLGRLAAQCATEVLEFFDEL